MIARGLGGLTALIVLSSCTGILHSPARSIASQFLLIDDEDDVNYAWQSRGVLLGEVIKGNRDLLKMAGECPASNAKSVEVRINGQLVGTIPCSGGQFETELTGFGHSGIPQLYNIEFGLDTAATDALRIRYEFFKLPAEEVVWDFNTGPTAGISSATTTVTAKCRPDAVITIAGIETQCSVSGLFSQVLDLPKYGMTDPNVFALIFKDGYGNGNVKTPFIFSIYRNSPLAPHIVSDQGGDLSPAGMVTYLDGATVTDASGLRVERAAGFGMGVGTNTPPALSVRDATTGVTVTIGR